MPRVFVGIDLPRPTKDEIAEVAQGLIGARWTDPDNYHVTLRFLGDLSSPDLQALRERLGSLRCPNFPLRIRGMGHFPPRGQPTTLWAGVERSDELVSLRNRVERLAVKMGFPGDSRNFFPHISLANVKGARPDQVGLFLQNFSLFEAEVITARAFSLYSSLLTSEGPVYTIEAEYGLDGEPNGDD